MEEFIGTEKDPPEAETVAEQQVETAEETETPVEIDVQKEVVKSLAADKAALDEELSDLRKERETLLKTCADKDALIESLKAELARKESELAAQKEKEIDLQERNPNALALLDREIEIPDRFPGETRDHVLEVIAEARGKAEAEGRLRKAQVLEAVLLANEPNGTLARKRAALEKLFADNVHVINGTVLSELKNMGISHKNGEEYLLPQEIIKRSF